jgi:hypothetical protein
MAARFILNKIELSTGEIKVYASPRISRALEEVTSDLTVYQGVRLIQLFEAIYAQGKKDGARDVFDNIGNKIAQAEKEISHKNPGKPKKKKK